MASVSVPWVSGECWAGAAEDASLFFCDPRSASWSCGTSGKSQNQNLHGPFAGEGKSCPSVSSASEENLSEMSKSVQLKGVFAICSRWGWLLDY